MKSDTVIHLLFLAIIFESVFTLETKLKDDDQNQAKNLPRWFDPATMRIVKKDDTLYLGYCELCVPLSSVNKCMLCIVFFELVRNN